MPAPERPLTPPELDELERLNREATAGQWEAATLIVAMRNALPALITAARRAIELEASLKEILGLIDDGYLIRDISKDHEPGYAMRQLEPVRKLCNAVRLTQGDPNAR